jgi:hypothetical protein
MRLPIHAIANLASASHRLLGEKAIGQREISASSGSARADKGHADRGPRAARIEIIRSPDGLGL